MSEKWALVSGASRGLGRSLIQSFREVNWRTIAIVRTASDAESLVKEFGEICIPLVGDIREGATADYVSSIVNSRAGILDAIVNNAGQGGKGLKIENLDPEVVRDLIDTHCIGAMRLTKACLPSLRKSNNPVVVNISSRFGSITKVAQGTFSQIDITYAYRIAKAAQNMFTAALYQELSSQGIRVYAVHPGYLKTEMTQGAGTKEPFEAADNIVDLILGYDEINSGSFLSLDEGLLPW